MLGDGSQKRSLKADQVPSKMVPGLLGPSLASEAPYPIPQWLFCFGWCGWECVITHVLSITSHIALSLSLSLYL